ncbi:MAG: RsmB/NOP family class I SAM-dependent RNA methyltransferase [Bacteroidia bacterium]|nr:RsmB/NOP family class I SAM-dependent RNA methyltransferase [Bacteroidia bacterium]
MKLYKNLVNAVAQILQEIFTKNRYADKAIEWQFKNNPQWGSRDRKFIAEGVYDIVRNFRLYSELAESKNNFWFITAVWLVNKNIQLPDWAEFKHVNSAAILDHKSRLEKNLPVYHSYPDWLWEMGEAELGKDLWQEEAISMNKLAPVFLRANTLKTNRIKLLEALMNDNIQTEIVTNTKDAVKLVKRENVFQSRLFKEGWFEVQDAGSQLITEFLDPQPGDLVIDACAGAGGKSLHMAALMQNKGKIISMDVEAWKLDELKKRARRAGVSTIETRVIQNSETIAALQKKADKVLLDVPCSGTGVIKRNPDTKWKLSKEGIEATKEIQKNILNNYSKMIKPGGYLVYSTCSILPSENNLQTSAFLSNHSDYSLVKEKTILPHEGFDGFYMALLKRNA